MTMATKDVKNATGKIFFNIFNTKIYTPARTNLPFGIH
jgi:hypothetical protein